MFGLAELFIEGTNKLKGEVNIQGAKNSVLPILAATVLCENECTIHNCPDLTDVNASIEILKYLGASVVRDGHTLYVNAREIYKDEIPDVLMREMRSSIVFLGAMISKLKKAKLSFPGGCELGPRPIDMHLKALRQIGVSVKDDGGIIECEMTGNPCGSHIALSFPSVGATENILLASVLCSGITVINNAAREPEIVDLADFLNKCGAKISGAGEGTITVEGVGHLSGCEHTVIPDRVSAATFMAAAAVTGGDILLSDVQAEHLSSVVSIFEEAGCQISINNNEMRLIAPEILSSLQEVRTMPYPGFPTDVQAIVMAMSTLADGTSVFIENIFECRYKHVSELIRFGANIKVEGRVAVVEGVQSLSGATVKAEDLRGAASLVVAALAAYGESTVMGIKHLDRGYEHIENQLSKLGAKIVRK